MVHAHAALPRFPLDAKRIVATSAVIALHVAVLMLLMMPAQVARTPVDDTEDTVVVPDIKRVIPPPPPPQQLRPLREQVTPQPVREHIAIVEPPVEPVDDTVGALDIAIPDVPVAPDSFQAQPAETGFLQLATLVAPPPVYPRPAITRHLTGSVMLRIHVDAAGMPTEVTVEHSSGHEILDEAAVRTVQKRWRFVPATRNGQPIEGWALVPVNFVLQ